jgi:hypothetical protein
MSLRVRPRALACGVRAVAVPLVLLAGSVVLAGEAKHTTKAFSGAKVNGGTVTHMKEGDKSVLMLSDDFKIPDTPAPHWQVVDSKGNVHLLQRLKIKDDKVNKKVVVPPYVTDVAKVQIWCAWAETLLGEAPFDAPVK